MERFALAGEYLFALRRDQRVVAELPPEAKPLTQDESYRVQERLVEKMLSAAGGKVIGYKAAATNEVAQKQLQVGGPFLGRLLSASTHRSPAAVPSGNFTVRIVEAEFGFEIGTDVPNRDEPYTRETIAEFVAAVIPAIEIVDHRFENWTAVGAESLIADNAIHGAWVEGEPIADWRGADLSVQAVTVSVNGQVIQSGSGAAVLGHPLNVVAWIANQLPRLGLQLRRGDKLTTGTTCPVYPANPGDRIVADFGRFGRVEVHFTRP